MTGFAISRNRCPRYGEEIVLLLPEAGAPGADRVLRRLRQGWSASHCELTFSAGASVIDEACDRPALEHADASIYQAKHSGRNCRVHDRGNHVADTVELFVPAQSDPSTAQDRRDSDQQPEIPTDDRSRF
jgi:hypothetical protein